MPVFKKCKHCGKEFELRHRLQKTCRRQCNRQAYKNRYPERDKKQRDYYNRTEEKFLSNIKSRAKKSGIPFDLTLEDIVFPEVCPVLGIALRRNYDKGSGYHADSPSLDKIDPKLGYIKGNVRIISSRANLLKSNAEVWELELVLKDLKELRDSSL